MTEFYEIVDLTIGQLHIHPMNFEKGSQPIPALWWYPCDLMPSVFKYLPEKNRPVLEGESMADFEKLRIINEQNFSQTIQTNVYSDFPYNILHDESAFTKLYDQGNKWAYGCYMIQQKNAPLPEWISNKERELLAGYST